MEREINISYSDPPYRFDDLTSRLQGINIIRKVHFDVPYEIETFLFQEGRCRKRVQKINAGE